MNIAVFHHKLKEFEAKLVTKGKCNILYLNLPLELKQFGKVICNIRDKVYSRYFAPRLSQAFNQTVNALLYQ